MKYIIFDKEFTKKSIKKLVKNINSIDDDITLYISSNGGYVSEAHILADIINDRGIKVVPFDSIQSSAAIMIYLLLEQDVVSELVDSVMFHKVNGWEGMNHIDEVSIDDYNKWLYESLAMKGVSSTLLDVFDKGGDLILSSDDMW